MNTKLKTYIAFAVATGILSVASIASAAIAHTIISNKSGHAKAAIISAGLINPVSLTGAMHTIGK